MAEVPLASGHRADLMALTPSGAVWIIEIKVSAADLKGDRKWPVYREWCDAFCWAVPPALGALLDAPVFAPQAAGRIIADAHEAVLERPPLPVALGAARRRAVTLSFARRAALRLMMGADPYLVPPDAAARGAIPMM